MPTNSLFARANASWSWLAVLSLLFSVASGCSGAENDGDTEDANTSIVQYVNTQVVFVPNENLITGSLYTATFATASETTLGDPEICDGRDNDGDGRTDEGFDSDYDGIADCYDIEECDGKDNDGDSELDEGFDGDFDGIADCDDIEECDGLDNDGDGDIDEDLPLCL